MGTFLKPDVEVLARLAEAFNMNGSMKKTHLHLASRISWNSFVRYLTWLENSDYVQRPIEITDDRYVLTETGKEMFSKLMGFLECLKSKKTLMLQS